MSDNLSLLASKKGWIPELFESISNIAENTSKDRDDQLRSIAEKFLMGPANTLGTLSFYDHFNPDHLNKKIFVCNGTACLVSGTQQDLRNKLNDHINDQEIGEMCCLGRCHENSAFHYQGINYSGKDVAEIEKILTGSKNLSKDTYQVRSALKDPVLTHENDFEHYKRLFNSLLEKDVQEVLEEIKCSKLRGRGGAGFSTGDKLEACKVQQSYPKFLVCNADEGDPGSYSDRYLLEEQPHAVWFGMLIAARVIGAEHAIVYIRAEYPESIQSMESARDLWVTFLSDLIKENKLAPLNPKIVKGAGSYICGEESALLSSLEGQRPEVRIRPPYPTESGLFLKPTVVNNVETLANIPYILQHGAAAYKKLGTNQTPGVKLICLDGLFNQPGIVEVAMGTQLDEVIYTWGGGFKMPVKALQIGGPLGGIVPISQTKKLTIDYESFKSNGFDLGHASIVSIPESFPMIKYLEHLFEFTAHESCGKCAPCRIGSIRGKELIKEAQSSKASLQLLKDLLETLEQGSLCGLGKTLPLPVVNALSYFDKELEPYFGD
ncbi:MAG: NADH-ubiquinone oxidoreductase-F iron-sulfur binding region domain-containing protein [Aurantibacter sp.]